MDSLVRFAVIHVDPAEEPASFAAQVRAPGLLAIAELAGEAPSPPRRAGRPFEAVAKSRDQIPSKAFPESWTRTLPHAMAAYREICAYSCFRIHRITGAGSVDHMAPKSLDWNQVYEWSNYRLASARMNSRKRDFSDVLDPFDEIDSWFELDLNDYSLKPAARLPAEQRQQVLDTIERLQLNEESMARAREEAAGYFLDGEVTFAHLLRHAPLIARELQRQGKA